MITVQTFIDEELFTLKTEGNPSKEIRNVFCCDILSIAMGKAPAKSAWVTVTGNRNTLAVASLVDISCIILAEGVSLPEADLACAGREGIAVFSTGLPIFEAALRIWKLLS